MYGFIQEYDYSRCSLITKGIISNSFTGKHYNSDRFIWDTGATVSCINEEITNALSLGSISSESVFTANGTKECPVYRVNIALQISKGVQTNFPNLLVVGSKLSGKTDFLVGMDIIRTGSFLFSKHKKTGKLFFEFYCPASHNFITPIENN